MVLYESRYNTNNTVDSIDPVDVDAGWFDADPDVIADSVSNCTTTKPYMYLFHASKGSSTRQLLSTVATTLLFSIRRFH